MTVEADPQRGDAFYQRFYGDGGWKYSYWREYWWHRRHFAARFKLRRGMRILEVGCGCGFHTHLLNRMGFNGTGVDRSQTGIDWAKTHYPQWTYLCCDLEELPFEAGSFDVVYARGLSLYHYDLMSRKAIHATAGLMRHLKADGVFIMAIVTDLSGRREPDEIWQNTLDHYRRHFSFFGKRWSVEWHKGMTICGVHKPLEQIATPAVREELEPALASSGS